MCFSSNNAYSQDETFVIPDSLKGKSYKYIFDNYRKIWNTDTLTSKIYLNTYYKKSLLDNDELKKGIAVAHLSRFIKNYDSKIKMLKKAISHVGNANNQNYLMRYYSIIGGHYLHINEYDEMLDAYFKSLEIAKEINNENYIYVLKHNIAVVKGDMGKFKESLKIFQECYLRETQIFNNENKKNLYDYLVSSYYLSESFLRNEQIDSSHKYINIGLKYSKDTLKQHIYWQFILSKGIYFNKKKNHDFSIKYLDSFLLGINNRRKKFKRFLSMAYYYQAENYKNINETKSLFYLNKLDSIFIKDSTFIPEVRKGYESFVKYYKTKNDPKKQLQYINGLVSFDSIYYNRKDVFRDRIYKEYETPDLLAQKEQTIKKLNDENEKLGTGAILVLLLGIIIALIATYQFKKRISYKHRFNKVMESSSSDDKVSERVDTSEKEKRFDVNENTVVEILSKLNEFEEKKLYVQKNLNSTSLAKKIGTNKKYLSQVVNHYKKKTITNYINDLRISFCIEELKANKKLINYTIKGIAEEMGFNNAESFSKAFHKHTGLKPSFFIKKLKNSNL